ncbi:MAG: dihydrodipicolinate synthase family protein [Planctomycetes bacterium]|nr:dihydrodipicolinate synthase family protein [Planctomycetota bacterium]
MAIPAHPLALNASRTLDERRQRALARYYIAAGSGGLAVGVHTTQFQIRDPRVGLFRPVLTIAREEMDRADATRQCPLMRIGGVTGATERACAEASLLSDLNYHAGLLSLAALPNADDDALIAHCRAVGQIIPIVGFYLQPRVGGRELSYAFWRRFAELPSVFAIKIAPFDRYRTLDVVRAVVESGREDIALYTGNDDNIVHDLITPYHLNIGGRWVERRIVGGLLGHWSVWTRRAVELLERCHHAVTSAQISPKLLALANQVTDANAAFFDAANGFRGVIAGLHEVLRRQGLLEGIWCLEDKETLGPGQREQIDRVLSAYPHLADDEFVAQHRSQWLSG